MSSPRTCNASPDMEDKVAQTEAILDYTFTNKEWCLQALQMDGKILDQPGMMQYKGQCYSIPKNERLATVGDIVLNYVLVQLWFPTGLSRGVWDANIRQSRAMNASLCGVGKERGLDKCVNLNAGTPSIDGKKVADVVEALIGAVLLDGGPEKAQEVIRNLGISDINPNQTLSTM